MARFTTVNPFTSHFNVLNLIYISLIADCNAGSLQTLIDTFGSLPEELLEFIAFDVVTSLAWLHSCHMVCGIWIII